MTDWNKLKVVDLKAELKKRGLSQAGLKPALVARLATAENEEGTESEATIQDDPNKLDTNSATSPDTVSPTVATSNVTADLSAENALQATTEHSEPPTAVQFTSQGKPVIETQPEPLPTQNTNIVESSQASAQNDQHESALPSVEAQEAIDDRQKRKRRSQSPPPSTADSARKRIRNDADDHMDGVVTTQEDANWVEKHNAVDAGEVNAAAKEVASAGVEPGPTIVDDSKEEVKITDVQMSGVEPKSDVNMEVDEAPKRESASLDDESPSKTRDSRQFKNLFSGEAQGAAMAISRSHESSEEAEPDRVIDPAIHPATSALYIRDIMRPLNPTQLKAHLATLAAPPGQEPDLDVIVNFYIDTIRTHAFVSFINTSAASRVRSALHDRIWPDEKTRKPLWVDFIPVEKLEVWIDRETAEQGGGRAAAKKWEVEYNFDEDRRVTASLQEASGLRPAQHMRRPSVPVPPVLQASQVTPRRVENAPSAPRSFNIRGQSAPMAKLDELFRSTTAKPMLYWQPVPKEVANRRLDNIDAAMSKDAAAGKRLTGPINRYTFEDGEKLVDRGPEIFPGIRPPPDQRRGGGRGGPPRDRDGGYRGRGGGGYGDRPPHRTYESFRPGMDPRDERDRRY